MGITRNQLKKLGFKEKPFNETTGLYYDYPNKQTKTLFLKKRDKIIYLIGLNKELELIEIPVVHIDDTGYFEMQKCLQDIAIGLEYEFKNQLC